MVDKTNTKVTLAVLRAEMTSDMAHVKELVTDGFKKVHARQDIANGRTGKLELGHVGLKVELENIEHKLDENFVNKEEFKESIGNIKIGQIDKESKWKDKIIGTIFGVLSTILAAWLITSLMGK